MILKFPDLDTLRLALTSGAVPPAVAAAPAAGADDDGPFWVETAAALPRAAQNELRRLGVQVSKGNGAPLMFEVRCWAELLPLQRDPAPPAPTVQTPVLFDLPGGEALARVVTEILRLGNDRQGFRWLEEGKEGNGTARALLRVVGPPYYSLLRALDHIGGAAAPVAYAERAPRVWVELGYAHPLAEHVKAPAGKLLLLRPPRQWTLLDDAPFRDVYEVLEFALPDGPARWQERDPGARVRVAPTLKSGGSPDGAELWVLRDDPVEELNRFVQNADDQTLHRLAFAVGERDGRATLVLRVRPSKLPPPVLVLKAAPYKTYLKLPNLFLPAGTRLHPPLRRDVVRRLLADDPAQVTWLTPGEGGAFTPETLPEDAFRPLADWVDYVLDHDREALQAWAQAAQFDFEPFVCADGQTPKPKRPPGPEKPKAPRRPGQRGDEPAPADAPQFTVVDKSGRKATAEDDSPDDLVPREPSAIQKQRRDAEERFLSAEGALDAPARQALWPELAALNAALGDVDDAGACWMHALWGRDDVPGPWAWAWFRAEAGGVPARAEKGFPRGHTWADRASAAAGGDRALTGEELDRLLRTAEPAVADLRALAAYVVWAAGRTPPPAALAGRLNDVRRFLEAHERLLPVRAAWLAWANLTRLSGGDVLGLARARDRLLERLFQNGLRPEQDLPGFLRFAGQPGSPRFRAVRQWLTRLCDAAHDWAIENGTPAEVASKPAPPTSAYIDLTFAFGLARLGEADAARALWDRAKAELAERGEVHSFLFQAFSYRVRQALDGKPHTGTLPDEQREYLEAMEKHGDKDGRTHRYVVERMLSQSRILEPEQEIDPYRHWVARSSDLERALAELTDVLDRQEIMSRVAALWQSLPKGPKAPEARAMVLRQALNLAPRVSEKFAREVLERTAEAYDALPSAKALDELERQAQLLERALFVAAHFDRVEHIHPLVARFRRLLQLQQGPLALQAVDKIAPRCFRGLRKLGMRDQIDELLGLMAGLVLEGGDVRSLDPNALAARPEALRALLYVAGGWYYFGREAQAELVMKAARAVLFGNVLDPGKQTALAKVYAATAGQAPVEGAPARFEELFARVRGVRDGFTSAPYYARYQLEVVEAVVLAVVSDDFTLGSQARRWLDEDEFLVRRRIHRDVRAAVGH
jgi:hypothetical protein